MMKKSPLLFGVIACATALVLIPLMAIGSTRGGRPDVDLGLISGVMQLVQHSYVHPVGRAELTKDALKGMLSRLDPHSDYMDEQEMKELQVEMSGKFGGLGIELSQQGGIPKVISPIDDTPAARAGIQPGDLIVAIDGQATHAEDLAKIVRLLRGKPGTTVRLTISRGTNTPFDVMLRRSTIHVQSVKSKLEPNGIGYVRITEFGDTTTAEFRRALQALNQDAGRPLKDLILDLRDNPGGLLSAAIGVASDFLDGGTVVTVQGRSPADAKSFKAPAGAELLHETRVVVLINGASASASEIVAGALQDGHRATIMGTQSFGKGSVQTIIPLQGYGALRLTTALYFTPAGRSIQGQGISPDIVVEAPKDQQVAGAVMLRESTLQGAFTNPGPRGNLKPQNQISQNSANANSVPIKAELIGTPDDAQLKAALAYLASDHGTTGAPPG
jgi:carboxyl-terminal processing protease